MKETGNRKWQTVGRFTKGGLPMKKYGSTTSGHHAMQDEACPVEPTLKKNQLPQGIKFIIYSYIDLMTLINKISNVSK